MSEEIIRASEVVETLRRKWDVAADDVEFCRRTDGPNLAAEIRADKAMLAFYRAANLLARLVAAEIANRKVRS